MSDSEIIKCANEEVERKSWGLTHQFLEIHELIYEDDSAFKVLTDTLASVSTGKEMTIKILKKDDRRDDFTIVIPSNDDLP